MSPTFLRRFAHAVTRSPARAGGVLLAWLILAAGVFGLSPPLQIDSRLEALLDDDTPSVLAVEELKARRVSTGVLILAVESGQPAANSRFIRDLAAQVRQWPEVDYVEVERDYTPLRDHALYYLDVADLQRIARDLKRQKQIAVAHAMAAGISDDDSSVDPDAVLANDDWDREPSEDDTIAEDETHPSGDPDKHEQDEDLRHMLAQQRDRLRSRELVDDRDFDRLWPPDDAEGHFPWQDRVAAPYADETGELQLLRAHLNRSATDLDFAAEISARSQALIDRLDPSSYAPDMRTEVGGNYASSKEVTSVFADLRRVTLTSATAVVLVLLLGLRAARGVVLVLVPVAVSVLITLGAASTLFTQLNLLSAFLFAVLLGIGVDFGVYLFTLRRAQGAIADWPAVFVDSFAPLFSSMLTTAGSLLVLSVASFRGFREFGFLAAIGVAVTFVVALTLVPALDTLFGPLGRGAGSTREPGDARVSAEPGRPRSRFALVRAAIVIGAVAIAGAGLPHVAFETDMEQLRAPEPEGQGGLDYGRATGKGSGSPVVLLAPSAEVLDEAMARLEADASTPLFPETSGKAYAGQPWLRDFISLRSRMPKNVAAKQPILREIHRYAEDFLAQLPELAADDPAVALGSHIQALSRLSAAEPLRIEDMPAWAREPFREKDGHVDRLGLFSPRIPTYDLEQAAAMTHHFRGLMTGLPVRGASSRLVMGDVTDAVITDTQRLPAYALGIILVILAATLRSVKATLACFASLGLGLGLTFGVMGLTHMHINFYNLVVMPAVVGLGIDASIHMWHSRSTGLSGPTTLAAGVAALTTAGGFFGLILASHRGLQSIGWVGLLATLACVTVALVVLYPARAARTSQRPSKPARSL